NRRHDPFGRIRGPDRDLLPMLQPIGEEGRGSLAALCKQLRKGKLPALFGFDRDLVRRAGSSGGENGRNGRRFGRNLGISPLFGPLGRHVGGKWQLAAASS